MDQAPTPAPPQPPPPEPIPETQPPAPKKRFPLIPLLIFLLIAALTAAGYFAYQYYQLTQSSPSQSQGTQEPSSTLISDPTADWQTYENKDMGFRIEHPSEYTPENTAGLDPLTNQVVFKASGLEISSFSIHTSPGELPQYPFDQEPTNNYEHQGYPGLYLELPQGYVDGSGSNPPPQLSVYIEKEGLIYRIMFFGVSSLSHDLVSQILSTFEFIQIQAKANPDLPNTFNHPEFTFSYPDGWSLTANQRAISTSSPDITLRAYGSNDPLYNECMQVDSEQTIGKLLVKSFSRVTSSEACDGLDPNSREKWIVKPNGEGFAPGIQFLYKANEQVAAETIFTQILATFEFTN